MTENVWTREEPSSPCVKICVIDPVSRFCIGCKRTGAEIAAWSRMTEDERLALMAELPAREMPRTRRGGRAARRETD